MTTITIYSDRPDLGGADIEHGDVGRRYEAIINSPDYLNRNSRYHYKALSEAQALAEALYGETPMNGSQYPTMSFDTATGQAVQRDVMLANGTGVVEEDNKTDF